MLFMITISVGDASFWFFPGPNIAQRDFKILTFLDLYNEENSLQIENSSRIAHLLPYLRFVLHDKRIL